MSGNPASPTSPTSEAAADDAIYINGPQPAAAINGLEETQESPVCIILHYLSVVYFVISRYF